MTVALVTSSVRDIGALAASPAFGAARRHLQTVYVGVSVKCWTNTILRHNRASNDLEQRHASSLDYH